MAESRDLKVGKQLGFAKAHHKTTPSASVLWELLKIVGFPFNICVTAEGSTFKFGMPLGLAKAHHENHTLKLGKLPYIFGVPL